MKSPHSSAKAALFGALVLGSSASCSGVVMDRTGESSVIVDDERDPDPSRHPPARHPVASLPPACWHHTATLLPDGAVLLVGNCRIGERPVNALVYDPNHGSSTSVALPVTTYGHQATVAPSGRVIISGGIVIDAIEPISRELAEYQPTARTWVFDAITGTVAEAAPMGVPRAFHGAARRGDDIVVTGGRITDEPRPWVTATTEAYDEAADRWEFDAPLDAPRQHHSVVALDGDRLVACGGFRSDLEATSEPGAAWFDPASGAWHADDDVPAPHGGTPMIAGVALAAAGGVIYLRFHDVLRHDGDSWTPLGWGDHGFWPVAASSLADERVLVVGFGYYGGVQAALYDSAARAWSAVDFPQVSGPTSRWLTLTRLDDRTVLAVGDGQDLDAGVAVWSLPP